MDFQSIEPSLLLFSLVILLARNREFVFIDPPTFNPSAPSSSQPITLSVRTGICHAFIAGGAGDIPTMRFERSPGMVDVIAPGIIAFDGFCNLPITDNELAIGAMEPGAYQVRLVIIGASLNFRKR